VRDQVSHPYRTTGEIIVLCILKDQYLVKKNYWLGRNIKSLVGDFLFTVSVWVITSGLEMTNDSFVIMSHRTLGACPVAFDLQFSERAHCLTVVHLVFRWSRIQTIPFIRETFHMISFINFPDNIVDCELQSVITAVPSVDIWEHLHRQFSDTLLSS
jgi:hypothetical protein